MRVVEHSVLWKERKPRKLTVFTCKRLKTFTEVDRRWTTMSSTYNHVRNKRGENEHGMEMFIREEVEHQERLEAVGTGHQRGECWRDLQFLLSATQLQGESAVTALPLVPSTETQALNPCTYLKFYVYTFEIPFLRVFYYDMQDLVGKQNVSLQIPCAWDSS